MSWNKTKPPKREVKPVRLRYQDPEGKIRQGQFVWSNKENTWIDVEGREIALYDWDGWKVLGWKS